MSLREELQGVYDAYGRLTPKLVLNEARAPESPLHSRFEWDDSEAAEKYRLAQAHELIQSVKITYRPSGAKHERTVREWQYISTDCVYEPAEKVARDPLLTEMVMRDMKREWQQLKRRYSDFEQFWHMVATELGESEAA